MFKYFLENNIFNRFQLSAVIQHFISSVRLMISIHMSGFRTWIRFIYQLRYLSDSNTEASHYQLGPNVAIDE